MCHLILAIISNHDDYPPRCRCVLRSVCRARRVGPSGRGANAGRATATPRPPVFKHDLPNLTLDDWEVTVSQVDYEPGRVGVPHHHAGFVLVYVLEGAVIARISGQGEEKPYTTGQMFYEHPGATHEVSKNASQTQPAKLLATNFAKKGVNADDAGARRSKRELEDLLPIVACGRRRIVTFVRHVGWLKWMTKSPLRDHGVVEREPADATPVAERPSFFDRRYPWSRLHR